MPDTKTLQPHEQRVVEEKAELDTRLAKPEAFLRSAKAVKLRIDDHALLSSQQMVMTQLSSILGQRIARW